MLWYVSHQFPMAKRAFHPYNRRGKYTFREDEQ